MLTIRPIQETDAEAFLDLLHALDQETKFMMLEPGERTASVEETHQRLCNTLAQPNQTILVADIDGALVGYLGAYGGGYSRNRHTAYLVTGIRQASTGQGIGKQLFAELDRWAKQKKIHRLELTVMIHNERAVALYQKMGFAIEGVKKDSLYVDGQYVDEYYMGKIIAEG